MQDLGNHNRIILDPVGNFCEIYVNLTVMTPSNLNHSRITQAKLCLKGSFAKASFMFAAIFLDLYQNPRRKNFINPSGPKHPKIINWTKKWQIFIFVLLWGTAKKVLSFWGSKSKCENKKILLFPLILDWDKG